MKDPSLRLVVVCENSAIFQWKSSVAKFLTGISASVVGRDDDGAKISPASRRAQYGEDTADVLMMNYHQVQRDREIVLKELDNYICVFDEVQNLRGYRRADPDDDGEDKSRYLACQRLSMKARYSWGLTATPIMGELVDLYAIMEVLKPGMFGSYDRFCSSFLVREMVHFRRAHFYKIVGLKNLPQLMRLMRPFFLKRPSNVIDAHLPKVSVQTLMMDMKPEQAKVYKQIIGRYFPDESNYREDAFRESGSREITPLTSLIYAQMTSDAPKSIGMDVVSSKEERLVSLIKGDLLGRKTIVYSRFKRTTKHLHTLLNENNVQALKITGDEDALEREVAKTSFQEDPDCPAICINSAGGTSLDLQAAEIVLFIDLPWSWGEWTQVIGRARRMGSPHERILCILLINSGTIDEHVFSILNRKEQLVDSTFGVEETFFDKSFKVDPDELFQLVQSGLNGERGESLPS